MFNPFKSNVTFLYPLKTSETYGIYGTYGAYGMIDHTYILILSQNTKLKTMLKILIYFYVQMYVLNLC